MQNSVGDDFQRTTKYSRNKLSGGSLNWKNKPDIYKEYLEKTTIQLPTKFANNPFPLLEALKKRESTRSFSSKAVSIADLSFLLWAIPVFKGKRPTTNFEQPRPQERSTQSRPTLSQTTWKTWRKDCTTTT